VLSIDAIHGQPAPDVTVTWFEPPLARIVAVEADNEKPQTVNVIGVERVVSPTLSNALAWMT
jgi:hypothetical protein